MYRVVVSDEARRFFEEAPVALQRRLDRCFAQIRIDPRRHPNIKPLKGRFAGYYRYRLGDYRVIYRIDDRDRVVIVAIIAHRREVYE